MPLDRMTLYYGPTGSEAMDALLDSVLRLHWRVTPHIARLDHTWEEDDKRDSLGLYLEEYVLRVAYATGRDALGSPSSFYTERVPYEFAMKGAVRLQKATFAEATYLAVTTGGTDHWWREFQPKRLKGRPFIATSEIAATSHETAGVAYVFRLVQLVKGLNDGIEIVQREVLNGGSAKLVARQKERYNARMGALRGKRLIVPEEMLGEKEIAHLQKKFTNAIDVMPGAEIDRAMANGGLNALMLLVLEETLLIYDLPSMEVVRAQKKEKYLSGPDAQLLYQSWMVRP